MLDTIAIVCDILMLTICLTIDVFKERSRIVSLLTVVQTSSPSCQECCGDREAAVRCECLGGVGQSRWWPLCRAAAPLWGLSVKRIVLAVSASVVEAPGRNVAHILKFMRCVIVPHWATHFDVLNMSYHFFFKSCWNSKGTVYTAWLCKSSLCLAWNMSAVWQKKNKTKQSVILDGLLGCIRLILWICSQICFVTFNRCTWNYKLKELLEEICGLHAQLTP